MFFSQTSGVSSAWTHSVHLDMFWSVQSDGHALILHSPRCTSEIAVFFPPPCSFRWHLNVCKGCCCWCSLNSATSHSFEACRHRVRGQGSEGTGYVLCIDSGLSDRARCRICGARRGWGVERWRVRPYTYTFLSAGACLGACVNV